MCMAIGNRGVPHTHTTSWTQLCRLIIISVCTSFSTPTHPDTPHPRLSLVGSGSSFSAKRSTSFREPQHIKRGDHPTAAGMDHGTIQRTQQAMNYLSSDPGFSMVASNSTVFEIRQLHLQQQRQISELTARCHELAEAQAEARRASAAEICLLKSQLNELKNQFEIFRADGRPAAAEAACRPVPMSGLTRGAPGTDNCGNTAVADTCNPPAFVNTSGAAAYPDHIALEDREVIRSRMLRDRGPQNRRELQQPAAVDTQAATHESCLPSSSGPAGSELSLPEDDTASHGATSPQPDQRQEIEAAYHDSEETEDECLDRHIETDGDDDDGFSDHEPPLSPNSVDTAASRVGFGWDGKQEPRAQEDGEEPRERRLGEEARLAPPSTPAAATLEQAVIPRLAAVKTETEGAPVDRHRGRDVQASGSSSFNDAAASTSQDSETAGGVTTPPFVKNDTIPGRSASPACGVTARYKHQLFSASPTDPTTSTSFVSDSTNTSADLSDPVAQRDAPDVETRENSESFSISKAEATRPPPRDRYQHCTFCSVCRKDRTDSKAVAKCEACPRILCRKCARREGETVLKSKYADDVVLPLRKCRCQTKDLEFPKPKKGKDPQAHLLKHLLWHDLSVMFREPVNVEENPGYLGVVPREEMMDLGTMEKRLNKGQYHTPRGQKKFRTDLEKIWVNCWKFAGYKPGSSDDRAGIVTCTLILEAMIERFYADYMERQEELAVDDGSWQADWERRKREQFARIAYTPLNPACGSCADQLDPVDGTDEETDSDDENMRIGDSICHKRKFGSDSSKGQAALNTTAHASTSAPLVDGAGSSTGGRVACNVEGLDQNMCALAAIGKTLGDSSSKR